MEKRPAVELKKILFVIIHCAVSAPQHIRGPSAGAALGWACDD